MVSPDIYSSDWTLMNTSSLNVILKQLAINNGLKKELEDLIGP
jgi:hypothetical protein